MSKLSKSPHITPSKDSSAFDVQNIYHKKMLEFENIISRIQKTATISYSDGKYNGEIDENKLRSGRGIFYYSVGDVYFGDWRNDYFHGDGVYKFCKSEEIYDGELRKGMKEGIGTYFYEKSQAFYKGEWKNDLKHGKGKFSSK
jgi:hypothetical protein